MRDYNEWDATDLQDMVRQRTNVDHRIRRNKTFFIDILRELDSNAVFPIMDAPQDIRAMIFEILPARTQLALAKTSKTVSCEVLPFLYDRQIELRLELIPVPYHRLQYAAFRNAGVAAYTLGSRKYAGFDNRWNAFDPFNHEIIPTGTLLQIKKLRVSVVLDPYVSRHKDSLGTVNHHLYALTERLIDSRRLREVQIGCTGWTPAYPNHLPFDGAGVFYPVTRLSACPRKPNISFSGLISNNVPLQQCLRGTVPMPRQLVSKCRQLAEIARNMKERLDEVDERDHILDVFALGCDQMMFVLDSGVINRDRDIEISRARSALLRYYAQNRQHLEGLEEVRRARLGFAAIAGIWP